MNLVILVILVDANIIFLSDTKHRLIQLVHNVFCIATYALNKAVYACQLHWMYHNQWLTRYKHHCTVTVRVQSWAVSWVRARLRLSRAATWLVTNTCSQQPSPSRHQTPGHLSVLWSHESSQQSVDSRKTRLKLSRTIFDNIPKDQTPNNLYSIFSFHFKKWIVGFQFCINCF